MGSNKRPPWARPARRKSSTSASKGWVYVISNKAMPGLIKVGYSSKDPQLRADELNHTGSPHPYVVDYEMLARHPFRIEQRVHLELLSMRERKEWFRCPPEEAIAAIKRVAGDSCLSEEYHLADRRSVEHRLAQDEKEKQIAQQLWEEENAISARYAPMLAASSSPGPSWIYWVVGLLLGVPVTGALLFLFFPRMGVFGALVLLAIASWLIGGGVQSYVQKVRQRSPRYRLLEEQRASELDAVRLRTRAEREDRQA